MAISYFAKIRNDFFVAKYLSDFNVDFFADFVFLMTETGNQKTESYGKVSCLTQDYTARTCSVAGF